MVFIIYKSSAEKLDKLEQIIKPLVQKKQLENYSSIQELTKRLQQPRKEEAVGIFLPENTEDLSNLLSINHLVRDVRIILVLPDRNEKTISIGHSLRPRFLTYADGNFNDVAAVMSKMIGNYRDEENQRSEVYA